MLCLPGNACAGKGTTDRWLPFSTLAERGHTSLANLKIVSQPPGSQGQQSQEIMKEGGRWTKTRPGANRERQAACLPSTPLRQCQVRAHQR